MEEIIFKINPLLNKEVTIEPKGWNRVKIEYSTEVYAGISYLCWKIQNTEKIFQLPARIIYEKHGLQFQEHFILTLEMFAIDYKDWESLNFPENWMIKYKEQYQHLIL